MFSTTRRFTLIALLFTFLALQCKPPKPEGGELRIRFEGAPTVFNPYIPSTGYSSYIAGLLFQTLMQVDPNTLNLEPVLLASAPVTRQVTEGPYAGMLATDFVLNPDAEWDNGTPVTAADVAFTLKVIFSPQLPTERWRGYFEYLRALEPDSDNPKKFTAYFSEYYILAVESMCQVPILPAYHYDAENRTGSIALSEFLDPAKNEALKNNPALTAFAESFVQPSFKSEPTGVSGSGPYRIASVDGDRGITLQKKESWWGDDQSDKFPLLGAYPERLVYKVVKDEPTIENMLRNRDVDLVTNMSSAKFLELKNDPALQADYDFVTREQTVYNLLLLNLRNPKLADVQVRRAMAMAIDYDYQINTALEGMAKRTVSPVLPSKNYYAKDINPYPFNLDSARALLARAGWTDSNRNGTVDKVLNGKTTEFTLNILVPTSKTAELIAGSLKETLQQAGIGVTTTIKDLSAITSETRTGEFEAAVIAKGIYPGLTDFFQEYHSGSVAPRGDNRGFFVNPTADSLITLVRTTADENQRNVYYRQIQQILHDDVPNIFLFSSLNKIIVSKKFDPVLSSNRPGYYEYLFRQKP